MLRLSLANPVITADTPERFDDGFNPLNVGVVERGQLSISRNAAGAQFLFQGWANAGDEFEIVRRFGNGQDSWSRVQQAAQLRE